MGRLSARNPDPPGVVRSLCDTLGLDPDTQSPTRRVVKHIGESLVKAMQLAWQGAPPPPSWWLVNVWCTQKPKTTPTGSCWARWPKWPRAIWAGPESSPRSGGKDEDHHLYHTKGWCRELAIEALGLPAVLPPPEEVKNVETAIGASRAEQQRERML